MLVVPLEHSFCSHLGAFAQSTQADLWEKAKGCMSSKTHPKFFLLISHHGEK